jgi:hypothetical protein
METCLILVPGGSVLDGADERVECDECESQEKGDGESDHGSGGVSEVLRICCGKLEFNSVF